MLPDEGRNESFFEIQCQTAWRHVVTFWSFHAKFSNLTTLTLLMNASHSICMVGEQKADNADDEQAHEFASPASHEEGDESEGCQDDDEVPDVY